MTRFILEVRTGTDTTRKLVIADGAPRTVGRSHEADEPFSHDPYMSATHAALWIEGGRCQVRDLNSERGTWVNDQNVSTCTLAEGDRVQIGGTLFHVSHDAPVAIVAAVTESFPTREAHVHAFLQGSPGDLFAVLDAARDDDVLVFLHESKLQFQSLYDGWRGQELALVAPYLVSLPYDAAALGELVERAWGESWGVFLHASISFRDVRRQLRRSLRAELDDGERVLFRFYDPRVLRAYLPTCTGEEAAQVYGPITDFVTEGRRGETALRFRATRDGVVHDEVALTANEGV